MYVRTASPSVTLPSSTFRPSLAKRSKRFKRSCLVHSASRLSLLATMGNGKSQPVYPSTYRGRRRAANRRVRPLTTFDQQSPSDDAQVHPQSGPEPWEQDSPGSQFSNATSSYSTLETQPGFLRPLFSPFSSAFNSPRASAAPSPRRSSQASPPATSSREALSQPRTSLSPSNLASSARGAQALTTTQQRRPYRRQHSASITGAPSAIPTRALPTTWNWASAGTGSTTTPDGSTPERSTYPLSPSSPIANLERLERATTLTPRSILRTSNQPNAHTGPTTAPEPRARARDRTNPSLSSLSPIATAQQREWGSTIVVAPRPLQSTGPSSRNPARRAHSHATDPECQLGVSPVSLPINVARRIRTRWLDETTQTPYNTPESR